MSTPNGKGDAHGARKKLHQSRSAGINVAANMRALRRRRGWTQEELGERLGGWSKASVSAAECSAKAVNSGRMRAFDIDEVVFIADIFGVSVEEMITPLPPCPCCHDEPAPGMACQECGASGPKFVRE